MSRYCNMCGYCCKGFTKDSGVVIFPSEVSSISDSMNIEPSIFMEAYCKPILVDTGVEELSIYFIRDINGACCFLKKNECSIHEIKPYQCTFWPSIKLLPSIVDKPCFMANANESLEYIYPDKLLDELFNNDYRKL